MFCGINPEPINTVFLHKVLDPSVHRIDNGGVLGIEIEKRNRIIAQPALLNIGLVIVIGDETLSMERRLGAKGLEKGIVEGFGGDIGSVGGVCDQARGNIRK